jgi:hypothetical protein
LRYGFLGSDRVVSTGMKWVASTDSGKGHVKGLE